MHYLIFQNSNKIKEAFVHGSSISEKNLFYIDIVFDKNLRKTACTLKSMFYIINVFFSPICLNVFFNFLFFFFFFLFFLKKKKKVKKKKKKNRINAWEENLLDSCMIWFFDKQENISKK